MVVGHQKLVGKSKLPLKKVLFLVPLLVSVKKLNLSSSPENE